MLNKRIICILVILAFLPACAPYSLPVKKIEQREFAFDYYRQSQQQFLDKNNQAALELIDKAILINPNFANFHMLRGDILHALDQSQNALAAYRAATAKRSNFTDAYLRMAHIFSLMQDHDQSIQYFRKALSADEQQTEIYFEIAREALAMGETNLALDQLQLYRIAATGLKQPLSYEYFQLKGRGLFELEKYEMAISELEKGDNLYRRDETILTLLAQCNYEMTHFERGFAYSNRLLALDSKSGMAYYLRGIYYYQNQKWNDARTQTEIALQYAPGLLNADLLMGKIFFSSGDSENALKWFKQFKTSSEDADAIKEAEELIRKIESASNITTP